MARIVLTSERHKLDALSDYIRCEMRRQKISQERAARETGCVQQSFSVKLSNGYFTAADLIALFKLLKTPPEKVGELLGESVNG